jgi:hypothetical protein
VHVLHAFVMNTAIPSGRWNSVLSFRGFHCSITVILCDLILTFADISVVQSQESRVHSPTSVWFSRRSLACMS